MTLLLVVEDNAIFADTVVRFLSKQPGLEVVAVASTAEEALERLPFLQVDLLLVDVSLPTMNGIDLVAEVHRQRPELRCLMLSGHNERDYVRRALDAGALGYVLKENPLAMLEAVRAVTAGQPYVSQELRAKLTGAS